MSAVHEMEPNIPYGACDEPGCREGEIYGTGGYGPCPVCGGTGEAP